MKIKQPVAKRWQTIMRSWLPLAFVISALITLVYASGQQILRQGANDPQIQMAEDAATALVGGQPADFVVNSKVDAGQSLAPFLIVYDSAGKVVSTGVFLNGQVPQLPSSVFAHVDRVGQSRFTWQPASGVRIAAVVVKYQAPGRQGYILAGRSLREVEQREAWLFWQSAAAWLFTVLGSLLLIATLDFWRPKHEIS